MDDLFKKNLEQTKQRLRESVKFDTLLVQAINNIDELNKSTNLLAKRLREWFELYNPEFSKDVPDNEKFAELVTRKQDKKEKGSMGAELPENDLRQMRSLAAELNNLYKLKENETGYVEELMQKNCPNMEKVAGALIGAKLIEIAGSLERLAKMPASTVQMLGAEKALFRHIKTGAKAPKYGVIFAHPFISEAKIDRGKRARALADKISVASKVDFFKGEFAADRLLQELKKKFGG